MRSGLAVLLVLALATLGACAKKNPDTRPGDIHNYVALGDSYTSGVALDPLSFPACNRSERNYPSLVASDLDIENLQDASCGGAASKNLTETQTTPTGSNQPQLTDVNEDTDLVTMGLGLNDYAISYFLLYVCLPLNGQVSAACNAYLSKPQSSIDTALRNMGGLVKADLDEIRKRGPNARIVLVGYPRFLPDTGECPAQVPLPGAALDRIRVSLVKANDILERAARRARVDFVDMYTASQGHDVCSSDPWVNGQTNIAGKAYAFHPFAAYHQAVAAKLEYLLTSK